MDSPLSVIAENFSNNVSTAASAANIKIMPNLDRFEQTIYDSAGYETKVIYADNASDLAQLTGQGGVIYPDPKILEVSIDGGRVAQKLWWGINQSKPWMIACFCKSRTSPGSEYELTNITSAGVTYERGPNQAIRLPLSVLFIVVLFFFLGLKPGFWDSPDYDDY